ncbi:hypothetical protein VPHK375_0013 [Vibrio phage K375]
MKNADIPAMPVNSFLKEGDLAVSTNEFQGLTKREMIAMHAMGAYLNGQLSWTNGVDGGCTPSFEEVATESVAYADALLEELNK